MQTTREQALGILRLPSTTTNIVEIKQAYRKAALVTHPDKHFDKRPDEREKYEAEFKTLSDAYFQLIESEAKDEKKEFSPSWLNIIRGELKGGSAGTVATPDEHKPSIPDFFLSLKRSLYKLERRVSDSKFDEFIAVHEGITAEQQLANHIYALQSINAANNIVLLLEDHIRTSDPNHWKIAETLRLVQLARRLDIEFKKFGINQLLEIRDANTFELAQILLNYLAYLRNPLNNFKSTEDKLHLTLLEDISDKITTYHNVMLRHIDRYHTAVTVLHGSLGEHLTLLTDKANILAHAEVRTPEALTRLKEDINHAKEYVINHCQYPDNIHVFNPSTDKMPHRYGIRGAYRRCIIQAMFVYNSIPGVEPFSAEELGGYKSFIEFYEEESKILVSAQEQGIPAHLIPITGQRFIDAHRGKTLLLSVDEEKAKETKGSEVRTSSHSLVVSHPEDIFVPPKIIHATELIDRENDLIKILGGISSQKIGMHYMQEEKDLAIRIDEMKDCPKKNQAKIILSAIQDAIKTTRNPSEIKELAACLQDTRLATLDSSTIEDGNKLIATAKRIKICPSYKWKVIGAAMMALGALLIPAGICIAKTTAITTVGAALFAGGAALFYYEHSRKTTISEAAEKIAVSYGRS